MTPYVEIARKTALETRWCFGCRKRLPHDWVTLAPVGPRSYYGAHGRWECSGCGKDRTRLGS